MKNHQTTSFQGSFTALLFLSLLLPPSPLGAQAPTALRSSQPKLISEVSGLNDPQALAASVDSRIFVTESGGALRLIRLGALEPGSWFSLPYNPDNQARPRFGGVALHPSFPSVPKVYVTAAYSREGKRYAGILVLEEIGMQGSLDSFLVDDVEIPEGHDPGRIKFGPDGHLYWSLADDPAATKAQDPESVLGKILRISQEGTVPADNPTSGSYIYASGFKAAYGLAWSPLNQQAYLTDYGAGNFRNNGPGRDEVNILEPGKNYGYPLLKGAETRAGFNAPLQNSTSARGWATNGAAFLASGKWEGSFLMAGGAGAELIFRFVFDAKDPRKTLWGEEHLTRQKGPFMDVTALPDGRFLVLTRSSVLEYTP